MKALVYGGPGKKEWKEVPDPKIQKPTDVIVKVETPKPQNPKTPNKKMEY